MLYINERSKGKNAERDKKREKLQNYFQRCDEMRGGRLAKEKAGLSSERERQRNQVVATNIDYNVCV